MPSDVLEKASASPAAATPANLTPGSDKPKTASETRKSSKPIMEKRRRARINESLSQLKTLILDALKKDSSRHSKLEKADILEMTVKHLRNLQRAQMTVALSTDPTVLGKYRAGFSECMNEVTRFLSTCEGVNSEVRTRLLSHLANCMSQINAMNYCQPLPPPPPGQAGVTGASHAAFGQPLHVHLPGSLGNGVAGAGALNVSCKLTSGAPVNGAAPGAAKMCGGFQLVPASDGQFAFLIPNAAFGPGGQLTAGPVIPLYANASTLAPSLSNASNSSINTTTSSSSSSSSISPVNGSLLQTHGISFPAALSLANATAVSPLGAVLAGDCLDSVWRPW
ncbi:transcription factor HES-1-B [Callorhinchus milii]|uniref:Hairy-related 6 n=1 Tax=Callorhinchus milii TaxID=7868 RepID=A0A4W3GLX4_CALMI|nr:transcription factor HES-1-B [Callorhinchus milii]|eukprot:gi/632991021/ref/XP_007884436.1/ PREDICTED: transcription factor HES-1-B-like [Callorhinchus milii]